MSSNIPGNARVVLLDIDGTLLIDGAAIPGAADAVASLRRKGLAVRFVSNSTMRPLPLVAERLARAGIPAEAEDIYTPARAALDWLKTHHPDAAVLPLVHSDLLPEIRTIQQTASADADFVLVGDMGDQFGADRLNLALRAMLRGAELLALERNRCWLATDGMRIAAGPVVAALEHASGRASRLTFGKPEWAYFSKVLEDAGATASEAVMVGDDLASDVLGAQQHGLFGVLVRTGKFSADPDREGLDRADAVIDSIAGLPPRFGGGM